MTIDLEVLVESTVDEFCKQQLLHTSLGDTVSYRFSHQNPTLFIIYLYYSTIPNLATICHYSTEHTYMTVCIIDRVAVITGRTTILVYLL